jgi:hypothetical protein
LSAGECSSEEVEMIWYGVLEEPNINMAEDKEEKEDHDEK